MKKLKLLVLTTLMSVAMSLTAFAGAWMQDATGWWYQNDDGGHTAGNWQTIDSKMYYFGADGYMLANTITPDGYQVGADGAAIPMQTGNGTRENPYDPKIATDFSYILEYVPEANYSARIQLLEKIDGGIANRIVMDENMFNEEANSSNRWVLYHFQLSCLSSNGKYITGDVVSPYNFFNEDSTIGLNSLESATMGDNKKGRYDIKLYPGGTDDFWVGILLDNSIQNTTFSVRTGSSSEIWFTTK